MGPNAQLHRSCIRCTSPTWVQEPWRKTTYQLMNIKVPYLLRHQPEKHFVVSITCPPELTELLKPQSQAVPTQKLGRIACNTSLAINTEEELQHLSPDERSWDMPGDWERAIWETWPTKKEGVEWQPRWLHSLPSLNQENMLTHSLQRLPTTKITDQSFGINLWVWGALYGKYLGGQLQGPNLWLSIHTFGLTQIFWPFVHH